VNYFVLFAALHSFTKVRVGMCNHSGPQSLPYVINPKTPVPTCVYPYHVLEVTWSYQSAAHLPRLDGLRGMVRRHEDVE